MVNETYDAIVVGAGPGGSACAALLAKRGMKILLLEKNDRPGGKALTMTKEGFSYELWPVSGSPLHNSQFEAVLKELEIQLEILPIPPVSAAAGNQHPTPPSFSPQEMAEIQRFNNDVSTMTPQGIDALDDITWHDFISRYEIPQSLYTSLATSTNVIFVAPIDLVAASEAIKVQQDFQRGGTGCYFKGGYGKLFETFAEAVKRHGGEIRLRTRVERVTVEDGQVRGVVTEHGTFQAPIVVSNAGIQPTVLKLVGEDHFDKSYVNYVRDLVPSLALMGIRYFLSKPVLQRALYVHSTDDNYWNVERTLKAEAGEIPEEAFVFMVVPSVFDPGLAPEGKQCALASTLCPPDAAMKDTQMYWDSLDKTVAKVWPEISQHTERKEYYSTADVSAVTRDHVLPGQGGECIGLAQIVGQCGRHKPSAGAPLRGLFYVGCDAGGYGCGTHQAVDSAVKVAPIVFRYHQEFSVS
jgi:prolycopene isomerase